MEDVKALLEDADKIYNNMINKIHRSDKKPPKESRSSLDRSRAKIRGGSSEVVDRLGREDLSRSGHHPVNISTLKADLDNLKSKYEVLAHEKGRRPPSSSKLEVLNQTEDRSRRMSREKVANVASEDLNGKLKEANAKNEKIHHENEKLEKTVIRLRKKADDRKNTLRQLFELLTEKEKELNVYKWNMDVNNNQKQMQSFKELMEKSQKEIEKKCEGLENQIFQKEKDFVRLEQNMTTVRQMLVKNTMRMEELEERELKQVHSAKKPQVIILTLYNLVLMIIDGIQT